MLGGWALAVVATLSLLSMVSAAKTHGRHLRLEREQAGFFEADFRSDNNPEWVQQLWRLDRVGFWRLYPMAAGLGGILAAFIPVATTTSRVAAIAVGVLFWGFTFAFLVQGARSWIRLDRATDKRKPNEKWWNSLHVTTWFWWTTTLVLFAGAIFVIAVNA